MNKNRNSEFLRGCHYWQVIHLSDLKINNTEKTNSTWDGENHAFYRIVSFDK